MFCNIVSKKSLHFRINLELVFLNVVNEEATVKLLLTSFFLTSVVKKDFLVTFFRSIWSRTSCFVNIFNNLSSGDAENLK